MLNYTITITDQYSLSPQMKSICLKMWSQFYLNPSLRNTNRTKDLQKVIIYNFHYTPSKMSRLKISPSTGTSIASESTENEFSNMETCSICQDSFAKELLIVKENEVTCQFCSRTRAIERNRVAALEGVTRSAEMMVSRSEHLFPPCKWDNVSLSPFRSLTGTPWMRRVS